MRGTLHLKKRIQPHFSVTARICVTRTPPTRGGPTPHSICILAKITYKNNLSALLFSRTGIWIQSDANNKIKEYQIII